MSWTGVELDFGPVFWGGVGQGSWTGPEVEAAVGVLLETEFVNVDASFGVDKPAGWKGTGKGATGVVSAELRAGCGAEQGG